MLLTDCLLVDFIYCSFSERSVALYYIYGIVEFLIDLVVVAVVFSHWLSIAPVES
jgi:TRAP-type mannitol/chloroaromatic compound transport system permease small subunit